MNLFRYNYINILIWVSVIVLPFICEQAGLLSVYDLRISEDNGPLSILSGTFMHGNWNHMVGNLTATLLTTSIIYQYYKKVYLSLIAFGIIIPSAVMYGLGVASVGISGMVFTLVWFIITRGLMSRDKERFNIGLLMLVFYGLSIKTAVPVDPMSRIAWQAHLAGLLTGFNIALYQRLIR